MVGCLFSLCSSLAKAVHGTHRIPCLAKNREDGVGRTPTRSLAVLPQRRHPGVVLGKRAGRRDRKRAERRQRDAVGVDDGAGWECALGKPDL